MFATYLAKEPRAKLTRNYPMISQTLADTRLVRQNSKAPGGNEITVEHLKADGKMIFKYDMKNFSDCSNPSSTKA
ncbi:jg20801 [Pararge aegeria aegeria]|uniref:Jg20801 protein n=1 Tax=Pararge aegeria aegeria TaxID=348720 RepID=A0A8S4R6H5_9NEOP|nr:jg20801 [Pararge aegeria aegeria]